MAVTYGGRACVDPEPLYRSCLAADPPLPTDWVRQANVFRTPIGRDPGTGGVLLTRDDLRERLTPTGDAALVFTDDAGHAVTLPRITLLRARCLTPGYEADARSVYLCDLTDRRFFLAQIPVDKAFNVRTAAGDGYLSATTDGGAAWTWAGVVQELWTAIGLGTAPALPFTPDGNPENLRFYGGWAWAAVNDVLDRLACAVKYDAVADTFAFVRLGDTAAAGAAALAAETARLDRDPAAGRTWDAYHYEPDRGRLPEKVRVLFNRRPQPTNGGSPYYAVDVTLAATAGVQAGTFVTLRDDLAALGTGTPTNATALATRAAERAADWRRKRVGFEARRTVVYRDFRSGLVPGETLGAVALDDRGGVMGTEIHAAPDGRLERWLPWEPPPVLSDGDGGDGTAGSACRKKLASLARHDYVTATISGAAGLCAEIEPGALTLYRPDPAVEELVSARTFTTVLGATTLRLDYRDGGNPALWAVGPAGGSSPGAEYPLTYLGCTGNTGECALFWGRPILCDSYPVTSSPLCPGGAPRRYEVEVERGTGGYNDLFGVFRPRYSAGDEWFGEAEDPDYEVTVLWVDMGGGTRRVEVTVTRTDPAVSATFVGPTVAYDEDTATGCTDLTPLTFVSGTGGGEGTPTPPTATLAAVGPCTTVFCTDNGFQVRLCCGGGVPCGDVMTFPDVFCLTPPDPPADASVANNEYTGVGGRFGPATMVRGAPVPAYGGSGVDFSGVHRGMTTAFPDPGHRPLVVGETIPEAYSSPDYFADEAEAAEGVEDVWVGTGRLYLPGGQWVRYVALAKVDPGVGTACRLTMHLLLVTGFNYDTSLLPGATPPNDLGLSDYWYGRISAVTDWLTADTPLPWGGTLGTAPWTPPGGGPTSGLSVATGTCTAGDPAAPPLSWFCITVGYYGGWSLPGALPPGSVVVRQVPGGAVGASWSWVYGSFTPGGIITAGPYATAELAMAGCGVSPPPPPPARYNCVDGVCVEAADGTYASLEACQAACGAAEVRYDCVEGVCVEAEGGEFTSLGACEAACINPCCDWPGQSLATHPDLQVTVLSGPNAGTYGPFVYTGGTYVYSTSLGAGLKSLACIDGVWTLFYRNTGGTVTHYPATEQSCSPFGVAGGGGTGSNLGGNYVAEIA